MNRRERFTSVVLGPALAVIFTAAAVNAYVDPLWMFPRLGERPAIRYCVADERQNKTNKMIFGGAMADSVIIGSSRSEVFDTRYFRNETVANIAVNGMRPVEIAEYLRIYVRHAGMPKRVYVGLDFFGYLYEGDESKTSAPEKERAALDSGYRVRSLVDFGLLQRSVRTIIECTYGVYTAGPLHRYDGVEPTVKPSAHQQELVESQMAFFRTLYDRKKPIDPMFRSHLQRIKQAAPGATIVAFIPPVRADVHRVMVTARGETDYHDWIGSIIDEFGSVVQFSGLNSFTENPANFYDTNHTYTPLTENMISILEGRQSADPDGFGQKLISADRQLDP